MYPAPMRLSTILLTMMLSAGCDVLLPSEWGETPRPCSDDGDCAGGYHCRTNHSDDSMCVPDDPPSCTRDADCANEYDLASAYCSGGSCVPWEEHGFGDECDNAGDCDDGFALDQCICFMEDMDSCYCTRVCSEIGDCPGYGGDAQCMASGVGLIPKACGRPAFTWGTGIACPGGGSDCDFGTICVNFPFRELQQLEEFVCAEQCEEDDDCPSIFECGDVGMARACGHPDWFGFYHICTENSDCDITDSLYPVCPHADQHCTRNCEDDEDCPFNAHCGVQKYCILD